MTKYYYIDLCDDGNVETYKDDKEFFDGLLWNRDVAREYGDKVPSRKQLERDFKENDDFYTELNGAAFLKTTNTTLEDWGW